MIRLQYPIDYARAKTVSYAVMHLIVAMLVAFALTRSVAAALAIGIVEPLCQTIAYHFHEKGWSRFLCKDASKA